MSEIESNYLERDQIQSTIMRSEYLHHFLNNDPVLGIEYEAQLQKTLIPQITASEVSKFSKKLRTLCSCVIKTVEPQEISDIDDLKNVVKKVNLLEEEGRISYWDDEHVSEEFVTSKPFFSLIVCPTSHKSVLWEKCIYPCNQFRHVVKELEYPNIGATELILSNGMRVCYKSTDFLDDQIQDEARSKVRSSLTPTTTKLALQKQYTVVILMPESSPFNKLCQRSEDFSWNCGPGCYWSWFVETFKERPEY